MRHRRLRSKMGVKTHHRKALLRNLVRSLVIHRRIQTTHNRAKQASSFADQMVELAKRGDLHARRLLIARLGCADTANTLIAQIAPHFKERKGGYTRVLRTGWRVGDRAEMALLEFTAGVELLDKPKKAKKEKKAKEVKHEHTVETKKEKEKAPSDKPAKKETTKQAEKSAKDLGGSAAKSGGKESQKKGGFLGTLRRFLKGDEEQH